MTSLDFKSQTAIDSSLNDTTKLHSEVLEHLKKDVKNYQFFAAVRLLESMGESRFGNSKSPQEDIIFFGQHPHVNFAPTSLETIRESTKTQHNWLDVSFFGLLGPNGPMPLSMSEEITIRLDRNTRLQITDFYNMFHHRLLSLLYRAWANKEPELPKENKNHHISNTTITTNSTDKTSSNYASNYERYIGSLSGYGLPQLSARDAMPDYGKLGHAAFLGGYKKHKQGLESILYQLFNLPVTIKEFIGEWLTVPAEHRCQLAEAHYAKQLGVNATLGSNSWQCQYKFQLLLGPLDLNDYTSCLPGTYKLEQINETIKNYVGLEFDWEINVLLKKLSQPRTALGKSGLLGWTTWLSNSPDDSNKQEVRTDTSHIDNDEYVADLHIERRHIEHSRKANRTTPNSAQFLDKEV